MYPYRGGEKGPFSAQVPLVSRLNPATRHQRAESESPHPQNAKNSRPSIVTRVPTTPAHSRGTTLLSGIPLTLQGYVFIPSPLITGDVPGQVYSGHPSATISVGGS